MLLFKYMRKARSGFTLIEMLIVVAIIGILASVVLIGLGPVQRRGRDARRIADLREVQTALELYFQKNGQYPADTDWRSLTATLTTSDSRSIGVKTIPNDPSAPTRDYHYDPLGDAGYVLGAILDDPGNPALKGSNHSADSFCGDAKAYCIVQ